MTPGAVLFDIVYARSHSEYAESANIHVVYMTMYIIGMVG